MLRHTVAAWPEREAFRQYDYAERRWYSITWRTFHEQVMRWRRAFTHMGLVKGERVAMLLTNCIDAVTFDEAALCGGLVPTPLHAIDTAGSSAYILRDSNARFLVTTSRARWNAIAEAAGEEGLPDMRARRLHERAGRARLRHAPGRQGHRPFEPRGLACHRRGRLRRRAPARALRRRPRGLHLHLGHHGPPQGRDDHAPQHRLQRPADQQVLRL